MFAPNCWNGVRMDWRKDEIYNPVAAELSAGDYLFPSQARCISQYRLAQLGLRLCRRPGKIVVERFVASGIGDTPFLDLDR